MFIAKLDCYIAGEFFPTSRALISYLQVSWNLTMKLFSRQNLWEGNIVKSIKSKGNSAMCPANVDQRPPLQRGLLNFQSQNFQGSASGNIAILDKENCLFASN